MKYAIVGAALMLASTTTSAQDLIVGQELWGGIKTGMTKAEVKALYPTMRVQLTDKCRAAIELTFQKKAVETVILNQDSGSTSANCGTVMLVSLKEKYGAPRSDRNITEHAQTPGCWDKFSCAMKDIASAFDSDPNTYWQEVTWFTGDMLVELYRDRETDNWKITYYQARPAEPEAATKL